MGYRQRDGAYRHPGRQVVFLGDLIDRGPGQLRVLHVVRKMVDAGTARIVMGNHEFNAVSWATPTGDGGWCRPHNGKNRRQHEAFLSQVGEDSALHRDWVAWFRTVPMWLELDGLRIVHACWHPASMNALDSALVTDELLVADWDSTPYEAVEILLKGPEIHMEGYHYADKDGHTREHARLRWWDPTATTLDVAAEVPAGATVHDAHGAPAALPATPLDQARYPVVPLDRPVLYGHYWRDGKRQAPSVDGPLTACLDWSVAKGGLLVAYRWSGEADLTDDNLVAVGAS